MLFYCRRSSITHEQQNLYRAYAENIRCTVICMEQIKFTKNEVLQITGLHQLAAPTVTRTEVDAVSSMVGC